MFDTADCDRIHSMHGDAVIVDPAELIELAEYLESITSTVYWEGRAIGGNVARPIQWWFMRMRVPARRGSIWSSAFRLFAALISFLLTAGGCAICTSSLGRKCRYMFPREASNRAGTIFHSLSAT